MNEDTKMILEEMRKMEERIAARMNSLEVGIAENAKAIIAMHDEIKSEFTAVRCEMNTMRSEMTEEFNAVRYELQNVHDLLSNRINTIEVVTAQNYSDIVNLRTKQA